MNMSELVEGENQTQKSDSQQENLGLTSGIEPSEGSPGVLIVGGGARRRQPARYGSAGIPPVVPDPQTLTRSYTSTRKIDSRGGKLQLCECDVSVPRDALTRKVEIKLETRFIKWTQEYIVLHMKIGPQIILGPSGTTFQKPVVVRISSCYRGIPGSEPPRITVETGEDWEQHEVTTLGENGQFSFSVKHFSPYRFLLRLLGVEKSIAHMSFTRRNVDENEYEMIWCFCDNLREAKMEVQKEMALQNFNLTKSTETFSMRSDDNIRVTLEIPESQVEPQFKIIPTNDLWLSDSMVKVEFIIGNLRRGSRITYKIDMVKSGQDEAHSSKTNTFTFLPDTGNMDRGPQGGATVLHQPDINTLIIY